MAWCRNSSAKSNYHNTIKLTISVGNQWSITMVAGSLILMDSCFAALTCSAWPSPLEERSLWLLPSSMSFALIRQSSSSLLRRTRSYPWEQRQTTHICVTDGVKHVQNSEPHSTKTVQQVDNSVWYQATNTWKHLSLRMQTFTDKRFKSSPCTFLGGGFHCLANTGRGVSPGVRQARRAAQWPPEIPAGPSGRIKTPLHALLGSISVTSEVHLCVKRNLCSTNKDTSWFQSSIEVKPPTFDKRMTHSTYWVLCMSFSPVLDIGAALHPPASRTCLWSGWGCLARVWSP